MRNVAKGIYICDDFFSESFRSHLEASVRDLRYDIAFPDRADTHEKYVAGVVPPSCIDDVTAELSATPFAKYADYAVSGSTVNIDTPGTPHYCHIHVSQFVFLYYIGRTWEHAWGGETLFFDQRNRDLVYASPYVPNRAILFDGLTPHTIRAPTTLVPHPRRTFGIFFYKQTPAEVLDP
jgi:hypothetical protein